jgi:cytidylate kinase
MTPTRTSGVSVTAFVVAIDGPAGAGKGTLARALAERFRLAHLDTGLLYRVTALFVLERGELPSDPKAAAAAARRVDGPLLGDPRLREERVGAAASIVAGITAVRRALLAFQRGFAARPPPPAKGAVLDGRDIGSVVCPEAPVKLYLTASREERARRRVEELRARGAPAIYDDVLADLQERDLRDSMREAAPLAAAADAVVVDTTTLGPASVLEQASLLVARALCSGR